MGRTRNPKRIAEETYEQFGTKGEKYGYAKKQASGFLTTDFNSVALLGYVLQVRYVSDKEGKEYDYYHNTIGLPALLQIGVTDGQKFDLNPHHWIADWEALRFLAFLGEISGCTYTKLEKDEEENFVEYELEGLHGPLSYNRPNNLWLFQDEDGCKYCITSMFINQPGSGELAWVHA